MKWGNFTYLLLLFLIPVFAFALAWANRQRKKGLENFADAAFWPKLMPLTRPLRKIWKQLLWLMALACFMIAFAEPKWGYHFEDVVRKGVDIFLLVDVSNSMLAEDIKPNRLERAKRKIYDLLKMSQGDRIGLIVFAGRAVVLCPLTLDYQAIHQFLESLSPDLIPIQGTDLSGALELAFKSFKDPKTQKALIAFTDGEDQNPNFSKGIDRLKEQKIPLYILGFGTPEGAPIPLPKGEGGFKRDDAGNLVISKLAEKSLMQLASATGGDYVRSVTSDEDLNELYAKGLKGALSGSEIKASKKRVYESRFQWPLGVGIFLLILSYLLSETKAKQAGLFTRLKRAGNISTLAMIILLLMLQSKRAEAGVLSTFQKYWGWKAFEKKEYAKAEEYFAKSLVENPKDAVAAYDLGNAYYRKGDYLKAAESFYKAAEAPDLKLKEKSIYNLGNSFYKSGQWENAVKSYEEALKVDSKDEEARLNLEFVKKKIQEKKEQEQKNQQNQSKEGEGKDNQSGEARSEQKKDQNSSGQNQEQKQNQKPEKQEQAQKGSQNSKDSNSQNQKDQNSQNNPNQSPQSSQTSQQNSEAPQGEKGENSKTPPDGKLEMKQEEKNKKEQATGMTQVKGGGGSTTHQEAEQWLGSLQEDASQILKNQIQKKVGKARRVEKDW